MDDHELALRLAERAVPGEGAVRMLRIGAGLMHETYRVERAGRLFSLRLPAVRALDLGFDRAWECAVLRVASAAGIAPKIVCCDGARDAVIAEWTPGVPFEVHETGSDGALSLMAGLLRRVHELAIPRAARTMAPADWVALYREHLGARGAALEFGLQELHPSALRHLTALAALPATPRVLCHSDLHRLNVLARAGAGVLLDWEYAHVGEPSWDLAGWAANNDWRDSQCRALLRAYAGSEPGAEAWLRFRIAYWLYDYVCVQWSALYLRYAAPAVAEEIRERAAHLSLRLKRAPVV